MKQLLVLFTLIFLLLSCKGGKINSAEAAFERYVSINDSILFAGSADLATLVKKTNYQAEPKIKAIVDEVVKKVEASFDLKTRVYFTVKGAIDTRTEGMVFLSINGQKDFLAYLKKSGYDVQTSEKINYALDNESFVYFTDQYAVMKYANIGRDYTKEDVLSFIKKMDEGKTKSSKLVDLSKGKQDIVMATDLYNIMLTNKTELSRLPKDQVDKINDLYKESYTVSSFSFENGHVDFMTKFDFNDKLKNIVKPSPNQAIDLTKLGNGTPLAGLAINFDLKKITDFWNEYLPGYIDSFLKETNEMVYTAYKLADGDLTKFSDGRMAFTLSGDLSQIEMGMTPEINLYGGFGEMGHGMHSFLENYLLEKNFKVFAADKKSFRASTLETAFQGAQANHIPKFAKGFGAEPFAFFIDAKQLFGNESEGMFAALKSIHYVYAYGNENMFSIRIQMVDESKNALEQLITTGTKVAESYLSLRYGDY